MPAKEYFGWMQFFNERPVGWREDHRAAMLMSTTYQGKQKIKPEEYFPALKQMHEAQKKTARDAMSFIAQLQSKAKGSNHKIKLKDADANTD